VAGSLTYCLVCDQLASLPLLFLLLRASARLPLWPSLIHRAAGWSPALPSALPLATAGCGVFCVGIAAVVIAQKRPARQAGKGCGWAVHTTFKYVINQLPSSFLIASRFCEVPLWPSWCFQDCCFVAVGAAFGAAFGLWRRPVLGLWSVCVGFTAVLL